MPIYNITPHQTNRAFGTSAALRGSTTGSNLAQNSGLMKYIPKTRAGKNILAGIVLADIAATEWYFWGLAGSGSGSDKN